jgi:disulfide oxidoreductase YuzD
MGENMTTQNTIVYVYGSDQLCPSCIHLPSSKETFEWLEAALERKFPNQPFRVVYVDIDKPQEVESEKSFVDRVKEEDMFYPVVVIDDEIVGEGNPRLKTIYAALEQRGLQSI